MSGAYFEQTRVLWAIRGEDGSISPIRYTKAALAKHLDRLTKNGVDISGLQILRIVEQETADELAAEWYAALESA